MNYKKKKNIEYRIITKNIFTLLMRLMIFFWSKGERGVDNKAL